MKDIWMAVILALLVWWLFTGVMLLTSRIADRFGGKAHGLVFLGSMPLSMIGLVCVWKSAESTTILASYGGFLSALAVWSWAEMAFLTGIVTGPNPRPCPPRLSRTDRFRAAWLALAYHELLLLAGLLAMFLLVMGQPNTFALWTYLILFCARILAKLNLFFGVPSINYEFIPSPLAYLKSHLKQGPITLAFPLAIFLLGGAAVYLGHAAAGADTAAGAVGFTLLAVLACLAVLEHLLMLIPIPDALLWRWMLPDTAPCNNTNTGQHNGH